MRYAVVVAPLRFTVPAEGSVFAAPEPVGPVCAAFARGGHRVLLVSCGERLQADFERALDEVAAASDLVVYAAAETTTRDGGVALRVDGETDACVALSVLGDAVASRAPASVLFVVEACHEGDADDPMLAAEHVDAILHALSARASGYGAFVGVRPRSRQTIPAWPFTHGVLSALDDAGCRDEQGAVSLSRLCTVLRSRAGDSQVQSYAFVRPPHDFVLLDASTSPQQSEQQSEEGAWSADDGADGPPSVDPADVAVDSATSTADAIEPTAAPGDAADATNGSTDAVEKASTPSEAVDRTTDPSDAVDRATDPSDAVDRTTDVGAATDAIAPAQHEDEPSRAEAEPPPPEPVAEPAPQRTEDSPAAAAAAPHEDAPASLPELPAIEPLLDLANNALERGALPEALAGYKAALMVVPQTDTHTRATIYVHIGELKRKQGKAREAELNFEKALAAEPNHASALEALVQLATENNETTRVIELRQRRLQAIDEADKRVAELCAIAETFASQLKDYHAAVEALDRALTMAGSSRAALERLRGAYESLNRWPRVAEVLSMLAEATTDPKERSALRFSAADLALGRLLDEPRGLTLLEGSLDDDPTNDKALRALVAVRGSRGEHAEIAALYERLVERFIALGETERAWDTSRKLGVLRRDKLRDAGGALQAFAAAVRCKPESVDSRALLAEMHLAVGDEPSAVLEFEHIAEYAPSRSSTFARLLGLHRRAGRADRAWLAGSALAELGSADMDQQLFVDQYRPDGPIRPTRSLDDAAWDELLRAPGADDVIAAVLRAVVGTAAAARVEELRQARKLLSLDPARRQSATSTVSVVRSFQWAAQVLGVDAPDLYVMDDVPGGIAAVHAATPTTALGPDVLRGLTTKDLAFLAGRHLTYYRPEHYALICYPTLNDLSCLFLGAVKVILPDLEAPAALRDGVTYQRKVFTKNATDAEKKRLRAAVERLEAAGGRADLGAWIKSVELTAQRAGLLLCGDLAVATSRLGAEKETRTIAELTFAEKRGDLLAFCVSDKLARARALLGVDVRSSVSVPPPGQLQTG